MSMFFNLAFSLPTAIYTGFVILFTLYWLATMIGMTEIEMLDIDVDDSFLDMTGILAKLKLDGVPATIALSLLFYFSWIVSMIMQNQMNQWELPLLAQLGVGLAVMLISLLLGDLIACQCVKPLRKVFRDQEVLSKKDLVGQTAVIRSNTVTDTFGEANFNNGAAGIIIKIRAQQPNQLNRGDTVLLVEYQAEQDIYHVTPHS
ncbi:MULTISPECIES: OB-fold-containig protein [unclassified Motilimonas]|uniref:OB-fold-containig protein n=1 Tax=Motilimonas TaxID=1914248 RepID=UPI001E2CAE86|nr:MULTISPECIES: OB-fold-containig protein [unclassified Motilimonas]MCE0558250.1 YqiJ family protein [Motilimonas sp. E26]MDO6526430.1 DUF1449 family protein [Motilimonas sp. 1_MG-2023]